MEAMQEEQMVPTEEPQTESTQEQEVAPAVNDSDAAFEKGFNEEPSIAVSTEKEPEPTPEIEIPEIRFAGYTESELKELLSKASEVDKLKEREAKVFGALGSLKQSIDQIRNQPRPSATVLQVTKEKLAKLSAAFPEMAEMLADDLSGVLTGGSSVDPNQVSEMVETKLSQRLQQSEQVMQQTFEAKVLSVMHPDWRQVAASEDFVKWRKALPREADEALDRSWDAEFIGSAIKEFKDWKSKAVQGQQAKRSRLEAAITPKGGPAAPVKTVEDAFYEGFKNA
jgi:hypothetical protein